MGRSTWPRVWHATGAEPAQTHFLRIILLASFLPSLCNLPPLYTGHCHFLFFISFILTPLDLCSTFWLLFWNMSFSTTGEKSQIGETWAEWTTHRRKTSHQQVTSERLCGKSDTLHIPELSWFSSLVAKATLAPPGVESHPLTTELSPLFLLMAGAEIQILSSQD